MSTESEKPTAEARASGERPWRSVEEKRGQLPPSGGELPPNAGVLDEVSRREFLKIAGLSAGLGLAACIRPPARKILPYSRRPEDITPGNFTHYASTLTLGGFGTGVLVTSYEGRPTKIEGNPDHPASLGAAGVFEQASLKQLYDPDRLKLVKRGGQAQSWKGYQKAIFDHAQELAKDGGAKLRLLLEPSASPLLGDLKGRVLRAFPNAKIYSWAPAESDNELQGVRLATGAPLQPIYKLDKVAVLVTLDSDLLDLGPLRLAYSRAFAKRRVPGPEMNRHYAVEPTFTCTGTMADHRLRLRRSEVAGFAFALLAELQAQAPQGPLSPLAALAGRAPKDPKLTKFAHAVAGDLLRHPAASLVVAGHGQPPEVHALAMAINAALGNLGNSVTFVAAQMQEPSLGPAAMAQLVGEMRAGAVDTLLMTAWNPCYTAPADLDFQGALTKVPNSIYWGPYEDETAARSQWVLPAAHALESWGDARSADGMVSLMQPLIAPLFGGVTESEAIASLLGQADQGAYTLLRLSWQDRVGSNGFDARWEKWLADGVVPDTAAPAVNATVNAGALASALQGASWPAPKPGLEIGFDPDRKVYDGRFGNNGWLQELPEPITNLAWDNAAMISPATADRLRLGNGELVELRYAGQTLQVPVQIVPGHADEYVLLTLGYGRKVEAEKVAHGVGFNAYGLRRSNAPWFDGSLELAKVDKFHKLVSRQRHWDMEGRLVAATTTLASFQKDPKFLEDEREPLPTLYEPYHYDGYKWGMAIDLTRCTGCSACVVACQAENNSPVVGKDQVNRGRDMHWLRIDRYFMGEEHDPKTVNMPVMCVHCEKAPCEYVCPVNATVHSDEGLNEQVYNRCVGTRYCSNNCPYKVRRFNFLAYTKHLDPVQQMVFNPDVTVRSRGVMEKCTYCVQRIERARIATRIAGRELKDGELQSACQQACPTEAIVFGNLNDPTARVTALHGDDRRYELLHELNTRPRTGHLARIFNPNPELT